MPPAAPRPDRRQFLAATAPALLLANGAHADDSPANDDPVLESQRLPEPKIVLPTDGVERKGPPKRLAAITTAYFKYSHADDIITKSIEGYSVGGHIHQPHCRVVSLYIDQFPETDIGKGLAARYNVPLVKSVAEALTV